ncbi:cellulose biosynthesis cyclic di-GMP-binding regulatory protein BcsB [Paenibacillus nanensis]|nr:cellulose biosynthesis cyclic di-GMP-binding regulatory protein BcsB [Paenibacillus nanensis]
MRKRMARFAALFLFLISAAPLTFAQAASVHYPIQLSEQERSLSDAMATNESYFHIPPYWKVEQAALGLDYTATPIAQRDQSSVTLFMNGIPFHSFRPDADGLKHSIGAAIPVELLVEGTNRLTVRGDVRTIENELVCVPDDKRDNWLNIHPSTAVDMQYAILPLDGTIRDFYERFAGMDTMSDSQSAVMVPAASENAELEAAAYAISGFSKADIRKERPVLMIPFSESQWTAKPYTVIVSLYNRLPADIRRQLDERDWSKEAAVQLMRLRGQHVLVATSNEPSLLVKAGRLLANEELVSQLDRDRTSITAETNVDTPAVEINRAQRLTETGDTLSGMKHQVKSYYIALPANRSISDASKVKLDFRYAKNLDFTRSMVTLLVNDRPIGSKKLSEELADGDSLTLPIPKNLDVAGDFTISAAFELELASRYCAENDENMPWAHITPDSMLQLNTKDRTDLLFDHYPYPFLRDGIFNHVAVVLPKEKDAHTYEAVANVFTLLGQYAEGNIGEIRFYTDDEQGDPWQNSNVITIGSYSENRLVREANDVLYFQFNPDGSAFISNEKMSIDPVYGGRLGALQFMESPYQDGFAMLAVTGTGPEYAAMASKLIALERDKWKIWGDAVVTDTDGVIRAFRFKLEAEAEPESGLEQILHRTDLLTFMTASILVLSLVIVSLLLLIRKYRNKRGGRG